MSYSSDARQFEVRISRTMMLHCQKQYRKAKKGLNIYTTKIGKSTSWWMFNKARHRYLKSMQRLRAALRAPNV